MLMFEGRCASNGLPLVCHLSGGRDGDPCCNEDARFAGVLENREAHEKIQVGIRASPQKGDGINRRAATPMCAEWATNSRS